MKTSIERNQYCVIALGTPTTAPVYGIRGGNPQHQIVLPSVTTDKKVAEALVEVLNQNDVCNCHAADVTRDFLFNSSHYEKLG